MRLLTLAFLLVCSQIRAQEFKRDITQTKTGVLVSYKSDHHGFSFELRGDSVGALEQEGFYTIDGNLFQASMVAISGGAPGDSLSLAQQKDLLKGYVEYELKYIKDNGLRISNLKTDYQMVNGRLYMSWAFDQLPPAGTTHLKEYVRGQVYYSTLVFDQVLDFNAMRFKATETSEMCSARIRKVAQTLLTLP